MVPHLHCLKLSRHGWKDVAHSRTQEGEETVGHGPNVCLKILSLPGPTP